jgi:hypothetical protein
MSARLRSLKATLALGVLAFIPSACADGRQEFPAQIELEEQIASSASGFFMEGCASAEYRLSESTIKAIEADGLSFFRATQPAGGGLHVYRNWTETPLAPGERLPWDALGGGCDDSRSHLRAYQLERALQSSGNFYTFTENHEGMLLIVPSMKLAAFFYVG